MADESEKPKVKCSECGMLALKESSATTLASLAIEPPEEKMRKSKVVNLINSGFDDRPYCCINAQRIHEKYDELVRTKPATKTNFTAFNIVIDEPRVCAKYVEWLPYFTPKEHIEMVRSDELAKANEERRKSDEAFREEIRKADRVRDDGFKREEMAFKASERRERRYQWFFTVGSTVAFALAGLAWGNAIFKQQEQPTPPTIINQITTAPPTVVNIITPPTVSTK